MTHAMPVIKNHRLFPTEKAVDSKRLTRLINPSLTW